MDNFLSVGGTAEAAIGNPDLKMILDLSSYPVSHVSCLLFECPLTISVDAYPSMLIYLLTFYLCIAQHASFLPFAPIHPPTISQQTASFLRTFGASQQHLKLRPFRGGSSHPVFTLLHFNTTPLLTLLRKCLSLLSAAVCPFLFCHPFRPQLT